MLALGSVVVDQTRSAADRIDDYVTVERRDRARPAPSRTSTGSSGGSTTTASSAIQIQKQATDWVDNLGAGEISRYTQDAISFAQGAAFSIVVTLFNLVLIVVIAIYMLLDMERLERVDRPPLPARRRPAVDAADREGARGLRAGAADPLDRDRPQRRASACGSSARPASSRAPTRYALLFGVWTAVIEVIPYIGPWLSAVPPAIYALVVDPVSVLWVLALFVFIYQVEGHIVVPNVMASALRLHPLLVIFGLLAGGELYGIAGVLLALPTMAAARAIWEFFSERVRFDPWDDGDDAGRARLEPRAGRRGGRLTYPCPDDRLSRHAPAAPAPHRDAARARARDAAVARRRRDAALRLPGRGRRPPGRRARRDRPALGRRDRARGCRARVALGVRAVLLFGIPEEKDEEGSGAWDADGIVQRALRALRAEVPA